MDRFIVAVGSDHAGFTLKSTLIAFLKGRGVSVIDVGAHSTESVDYPLFAQDVCLKIASGEAQRGLLVCGSGIGISIAANKFAGIRCALCHDYWTATLCREHNDANVIAMGERNTGVEIAKQMIEAFLSTEFHSEHPNHSRRLGQIDGFTHK